MIVVQFLGLIDQSIDGLGDVVDGGVDSFLPGHLKFLVSRCLHCHGIFEILTIVQVEFNHWVVNRLNSLTKSFGGCGVGHVCHDADDVVF